MQTEELVPLQQFCTSHHIEQSFIFSLQYAGLVQVVHTEEEVCIPASQLKQLEQMVRFNTEMDINIEGIETITYLLERMQNMQQQIVQLNNRLRMYGDE
jgi:chaperone modulatory protein CbpM